LGALAETLKMGRGSYTVLFAFFKELQPRYEEWGTTLQGFSQGLLLWLRL
jgi:hypothetical protein